MATSPNRANLKSSNPTLLELCTRHLLPGMSSPLSKSRGNTLNTPNTHNMSHNSNRSNLSTRVSSNSTLPRSLSPPSCTPLPLTCHRRPPPRCSSNTGNSDNHLPTVCPRRQISLRPSNTVAKCRKKRPPRCKSNNHLRLTAATSSPAEVSPPLRHFLTSPEDKSRCNKRKLRLKEHLRSPSSLVSPSNLASSSRLKFTRHLRAASSLQSSSRLRFTRVLMSTRILRLTSCRKTSSRLLKAT
jgi:hypothetical protein